MSTIDLTRLRTPGAPTTSTYRVSTGRIVRSEWTKFWSVRSPAITLLVALALTVGLGAIISAVSAAHYGDLSATDQASFSAIGVSLSGFSFSSLALGVLGVLVITGEYATGTIRASFTAVPKRLPVLYSKIGVTAVVTFVVMLIASFASFFIGQALLAGHHLDATLSTPGALRSVIGAALAVSAISAFGLAIGALLRNTAASITIFVAIFFVIAPLLNLLPQSVNDNVSPYLPSNAVSVLFSPDPTPGPHTLAPWTGFAVFCGYTVIVVIAAAIRIRKSDA